MSIPNNYTIELACDLEVGVSGVEQSMGYLWLSRLFLDSAKFHRRPQTASMLLPLLKVAVCGERGLC
jgi:hypothetical protein